MLARTGSLVLCLGLWCCPAPAGEKIPRAASAESLWEQGQQAMRRGRPGQAIALYRRSLALAPDLTRNHLSLAAAFLELGQPDRACTHLARYLAGRPGEADVRCNYADLLLRLHRTAQAKEEFERCVVAAQGQGEEALDRLIHCHSRLMEIAATEGDAYGEHLHRGIGLFLLARASAGLEEAQADLPSEGLFLKAAGELTLAREEQPDEARPCWYLYAVWSSLGQRRPARRCLRDAADAAPFTHLTPAERHDLYLARQTDVPARARRK